MLKLFAHEESNKAYDAGEYQKLAWTRGSAIGPEYQVKRRFTKIIKKIVW